MKPTTEMTKKQTITAIGLMSGTSLDGLDICCVEFDCKDYGKFNILKTKAIVYNTEWRERLKNAPHLSGLELTYLSNAFAKFCGNEVNDFLKSEALEIDFIGSHGHTVFHNPAQNMTLQIGNGAILYAETGIQTICDFRTVDIALNGQGAPLVPIGDLHLFKNYEGCLNLGGIANISYKNGESIQAYDVCFANMLLNHLTEIYFKKSYDYNGKLGKQGNINYDLLHELLRFHSIENNSLAREDFETFILKIDRNIPSLDILRTAYEYIANYLSAEINSKEINEVLVTGGGAHNGFLIDLLKQKTNTDIIVPKPEIINFKEALIFAFLGLLRLNGQQNCLSSVTKSITNNIGGAIYGT